MSVGNAIWEHAMLYVGATFIGCTAIMLAMFVQAFAAKDPAELN